MSPEDIVSKYEALTLAEAYAAISYALANLDEIAAEIAHEDDLEETSTPDAGAASTAT